MGRGLLLLSKNFNPRSPYGERLHTACAVIRKYRFQSTLPLRGATMGSLLYNIPIAFQSTLPLRGATLVVTYVCTPIFYFNPRSPYGERPASGYNLVVNDIFQSTLPLRGATRSDQQCSRTGVISIHAPLTGSDKPPPETRLPSWISIHAPLTGSDACGLPLRCGGNNFNPRSPYGERPPRRARSRASVRFQSTLPLRGATSILAGE